MYTPKQLEILNRVTEEIGAQAASCAAEQYSPVRDPDAMDEHIKTRYDNVCKLRDIRQQLENIFTGLVVR